MRDFTKMTNRIITSSESAPLKVVLVGAGSMGKAWVKAIGENPAVKLVAIADLIPESAAAAAQELLPQKVAIGSDFLKLARENEADSIINVTVPVAHLPVTVSALLNGFPVLSEKPIAENISQSIRLAAAADFSQELLMVSQSRRWNPQLFLLRNMVMALGENGMLNCQFHKGPRFGGFRDEMDYVLLIDMAIHMFDSARFLLNTNAKSVYCQSFNPEWSWYKGDAAANVLFDMENGSKINFSGTWCNDQNETSWDSSWLYLGAKGSATWDGENNPRFYSDSAIYDKSTIEGKGISAALEVFRVALNDGTEPMGEVRENIHSLAMVEGALISAQRKQSVEISEVFQLGIADALAQENNSKLIEIIETWNKNGFNFTAKTSQGVSR